MDVVQQRAGDVFSVEMSGQFTFSDHPVFQDILRKIETDPKPAQIVFCLKDLRFVDSAALGMLLLAHDAADRAGRRIVVKDATGQVRKMFDLAHFQDLFVIE